MTAPFGTPFNVRPSSVVSTVIVEPTIGYDVSHSALNLPGGATPNSDNFIMRDGRLEPRPMLSGLSDSNGSARPPIAVFAPFSGAVDLAAIDGSHYIVGMWDNATQGPLWWLQSRSNAWQGATYVTTPEAPPRVTYPAIWDWTQIFYDQADAIVAVAAATDRTAVIVWAPQATTFSTLTGAPGAKTILALDNYLLVGNTQESGAVYAQRVRWSDRGSASSWTGGLSGFEDLLAAKGGINRLLPLGERIAVFFDDEIWMGSQVDFPSTFQFAPLDNTTGCPYPRTATVTPQGVVFMARNFQFYLLPKEGGAAVPIGQKLHRSIRDSIVQAPRAFGLYDGIRSMYQLYYSSGESGNTPHRAAFLHLDTGAWAPQSFASATAADIALYGGFQANVAQSRASSWNEVTDTWNQMSVPWDDMLGIGNERQTVLLGSSNGTLYQLSSTATTDDGQIVTSFWESDVLGKDWSAQQKTITRVDTDYVAVSTSSLTVRALQGAAFNTGSLVTLPATSGVSQMPAYLNQPSRYAAIRVEASSQQSYELHRFNVTMRIGGR